MNLKETIRVIPDFPHPGIRFKDITTLLKDGALFHGAIDQLRDKVIDKGIEIIVGPEARGFVVGAPLAYALGVGFVPVRKEGKLPAATLTATYNLEYGKDALCIHQDAIRAGQKVLIADDLLATGGTIAATVELIQRLQGELVGVVCLIELTYLDGRERLEGLDVMSLIQF